MSSCNYDREKEGAARLLGGGLEVLQVNSDQSVVIQRAGQTQTLDKDQIDFALIQQVITRPYCLRCHSGHTAAANLDFSSLAGVMKSVQPSQPNASRFLTSIKEGRMPKSGAKPKELEVRVLEIWIAEGARENAESAPQKPQPPATPHLEEISFQGLKRAVLDKYCTHCHSSGGSAAFLPLDTYTSVLKVTTAQDISKSPLYTAVHSGRMPKPAGTLSGSEKEAVLTVIQQWIEACAPNPVGDTSACTSSSSPDVLSPVDPIPAEPPSSSPTHPEENNLFGEVLNVMQQHCTRCHDGTQGYPDSDFNDYDTLVGRVIKGHVEISSLYRQVQQGSMPDDKALEENEKTQVLNAIRRWIEAGTPRSTSR